MSEAVALKMVFDTDGAPERNMSACNPVLYTSSIYESCCPLSRYANPFAVHVLNLYHYKSLCFFFPYPF